MTAHSTGGKHEDKSGNIWRGWYRGDCTDGSRSMTGTPGVRHCRRDGIRVSSRCLKGKTSVAKKKLPFYGKVIWLEVSTERGGKYMQCTETKLRNHGRCTFLDLPREFSDVDELDALNAEDTSADTVSTVGGRRFELHSWIIRTNSPRCAGHRTACAPLSWSAYHKRRQSARLLRESGIDGRWMIISAHQRGEGGGNATAKQCGATTLIK